MTLISADLVRVSSRHMSFLGISHILLREQGATNWKKLKHYTREGANKQVISSQADSLIKISRIWADYFSHQQLESACLGRFFAISGVIPGF